MCEDAYIAVANSGVSDKRQPKAVLEISERIAIDRHTRFCDLEGKREESVTNRIEA